MNYSKRMMVLALPFILMLLTSFKQQEIPSDRIIGKWITVKKNLVVEIYKLDNSYMAKIIWFNDADDSTKPMLTREDFRNPLPELRKRKLIGMDVLKELIYNKDGKTWENGIIYDSRTGKEWSAYAYLTEEGLLRVKAFWQIKLLHQTMDFYPYRSINHSIAK